MEKTPVLSAVLYREDVSPQLKLWNKYAYKEAGNSLPNSFLLFFLLWEGKLFFIWPCLDMVCMSCDWPRGTPFPTGSAWTCNVFPGPGHSAKFNWGLLCLAVLGAHNPSGSKCLELKRLQAVLREYLNPSCQTICIEEICKLGQQYIQLLFSCN